jgi:hypothetical protein
VDHARLDRAVDQLRLAPHPVAPELPALELHLAGRREVEVDERVRGEVRVEREAQQAALALLADVDLGDRRVAQRPVALQQPDPPRPLGHQRTTVAHEGDLPRHLEPFGDGLDSEPAGVGMAFVAAAAAGEGEHHDQGEKSRRATLPTPRRFGSR